MIHDQYGQQFRDGQGCTAHVTFAAKLLLMLWQAPLPSAFAQSTLPEVPPSDLRVSINVGAANSYEESYNLQIFPDRTAEYTIYIPGDLDAPPIEQRSFTLTEAQFDQVWQALRDNEFFELPERHVEDRKVVLGGSRAFVAVTALGQQHRVFAQNRPLPPLDAILGAVAQATSGKRSKPSKGVLEEVMEEEMTAQL